MNVIGFSCSEIYQNQNTTWLSGKAMCELSIGDMLLLNSTENIPITLSFKIEAIEVHRRFYNTVSQGNRCNLKLSPDPSLHLTEGSNTEFYHVNQKKTALPQMGTATKSKKQKNNVSIAPVQMPSKFPGTKMPMQHGNGISHYYYTQHILSPQQQTNFLTQHIAGLTTEQAEFLLNKSRTKGAGIIIGGSRVSGKVQLSANGEIKNNLDVGFDGIAPHLITQIVDEFNAKFAGEFNNNILITHACIYSGNKLAGREKIISPEEFFLRSGKDLNGKTFKAGGFVKINPGGEIEMGMPAPNQNTKYDYSETSETGLNIDDLAWDKGNANGKALIELTLDKDLLKTLSQSVHKEFLKTEAENTGKFKHAEDHLKPNEPDVFVKTPALLADFLTHSLWKRFMLQTILNCHPPYTLSRAETKKTVFYITHYKDFKQIGINWKLKLGAIAAQKTTALNIQDEPVETIPETKARDNSEKRENQINNDKQQVLHPGSFSTQQSLKSLSHTQWKIYSIIKPLLQLPLTQELLDGLKLLDASILEGAEKEQSRNAFYHKIKNLELFPDKKLETIFKTLQLLLHNHVVIETPMPIQETKTLVSDKVLRPSDPAPEKSFEMTEHVHAKTNVSPVHFTNELPKSKPALPVYEAVNQIDVITTEVKRYVYIRVVDIHSLKPGAEYGAMLSAICARYYYYTMGNVLILITNIDTKKGHLEFKVKQAFHLKDTGTVYLEDFVYKGIFRTR